MVSVGEYYSCRLQNNNPSPPPLHTLHRRPAIACSVLNWLALPDQSMHALQRGCRVTRVVLLLGQYAIDASMYTKTEISSTPWTIFLASLSFFSFSYFGCTKIYLARIEDCCNIGLVIIKVHLPLSRQSSRLG